jgi:hypothetical protein
MRYKIGDYLHCDNKDKNKYCVIGTWEENWYIFYILLNIEADKEETLLAEFVDNQFKKIRFGFFKRNLLYNFFKMKTIKKIIWDIILYILELIAFIAPVFLVFLGFDFVVNLEIDMFSENSSLRVLLYIWFLYVNFALVYDRTSGFKKYL